MGNWRNCFRILKSILLLQELLIELAKTQLKTDLVKTITDLYCHINLKILL